MGNIHTLFFSMFLFDIFTSNRFTQHLSLNELAGAEEEEEEEEEEEDERHYWREPKAKKPTHEWVFSDELGIVELILSVFLFTF